MASDTLKLTEKAGDIVLQSRCLTYLTVTAKTRSKKILLAEQSPAWARVMVDMLHGQKTGVAHLRNGDVTAAFEQASQAVKRV